MLHLRLARILVAATVVLGRAAASKLGRQTDPCVLAAAKLPLVPPEEALACMRSFPFNETLRQNILANAEGVLNFFTFEPYYIQSPHPFEESTVNIKAELQRMRMQRYASDYDFSIDLYNTTGLLNDGHTRWFPACYTMWQNLVPSPVVSLLKDGDEGLFIVPDLVELVTLLGQGFLDYYDNLKVNWKRLAGAKVIEINGTPAYEYVDYVAKVVASNYLDHGIRVNSVYSSYRIVDGAWSQRFGYLAGPSLPTLKGLTFKLVTANATEPETVFLPYVANYLGQTAFTDRDSYWQINCALKEDTNGSDLLPTGSSASLRERQQPMGYIRDPTTTKAVGLPSEYEPSQPPLATGSALLFYQLPSPYNNTGVVMIGSFFPDDYFGFQAMAVEGVQKLKAAGVTKLIVDVHNNGGGYVCLGSFMYTLLAGTRSGYAGFQSTTRWTPLAAQAVNRTIERDLIFLNYSPDNYAFMNDTIQPADYNYMTPPTIIKVNGIENKNSQSYHDTCQQSSYNNDLPLYEDPPFASVVIVGNGNCASTCALFTTLMTEKYGAREYVFGAKPGTSVQYKGMAGNQVLDWPNLATEFKTLKLNTDPLYPQDLLIDGNFRVNWRTAWSYRNESKPIAYQYDPAIRVPYTPKTYNAPQMLWEQVASTLL